MLGIGIYRPASHEHASYRHASRRRGSRRRGISGVDVIGIHLIGMHLIGMHLIGVHLTGMYIGVYGHVSYRQYEPASHWNASHGPASLTGGTVDKFSNGLCAKLPRTRIRLALNSHSNSLP